MERSSPKDRVTIDLSSRETKRIPMPDNEISDCLDDNLIVEFIDGLLSAREIARVERHAARCDSCRRLLAELGRAPTDDPILRGLSATLPAGGVAHIDIQPGQEIGRFVVLDRIGRGGMGVVFSAYDPKLDRKVAIKLLHSRPEGASQPPQDSQMRLLREAQAMAQLSHPNVISVYDVGTYKSEVYIAMEFVEGETLSKWVLRWERSWSDILDKFVQAGKALGDAHAASLVHRDFKPDNVLIGHDNRVRVMDFGLARWALAEGSSEQAVDADAAPPYVYDEKGGSPKALDHSLTATGALLGTPRYMAPEQFSGLTADARSDQFSFCVALYEALYQQHPFEERTAYGLVESPETTAIRLPPVNTKVPGWLHQTLLRGMATKPHDRYASMGALLRSLAPMPKAPTAHRLFALIAVAFLSMGISVYLYNQSDSARDERLAAEQESQKLEDKLHELDREFDGLQETLADTKTELRKALEQGEHATTVIAKLERKLEETYEQLVQTQGELRETRVQLERVKRRIRRTPPPPPTVVGLSAPDIEAQLNIYLPDFTTCMREWSERERGVRPVLAVRFQIGANGVPRRGSKSAGIKDQVVYECVVGLLEDQLRFPKREGTTIANLGFFYENEALRIDISGVTAVEDVASPE
jgi:serine/threonine protein kinase